MTVDDQHEANVDRVQAFLMAVLDEAEANPGFAAQLVRALDSDDTGGRRVGRSGSRRERTSHRRSPGVLDPFVIYQGGGEDGLRSALARLDVEQLKDIVAEHGMDRTKLAMKWKTAGRLIGLIIETVDARTRKGDAFRQQADPTNSAIGGGVEADSAVTAGS